MHYGRPILAPRDTTKPSRVTFMAFSILLLVDLAVAVFIAGDVLALQAYPFDTDEANHSLPALRMTHELADGDWSGFIDEVRAQDFYPPGGSLGLVPLFLVAGPSVSTARLASTISLFLAVLVLFGLACEVDPRMGWLAGLIAGILTLTAQPLLLYAGLSMLETPGLLVSLLFLWAYVRAAQRPTTARLVLTSLLLAAVFLTKYSYGLVALATVVLAELPELVRAARHGQLKALLAQRWAPLYGPFAFVLGLWFLRPGQAAAFLGYTRPLSDNEPWLSLRNMLYYPRSFGLHDLPSLWFAPVSVAGLIWGASQWRDPGVRPVLLFFLLGMASVMFLNHPPNPRFIAPFVPAAHLLAGLMIAALWRRRQAATGTARQTATALLPAIALLALAGIPQISARFRLAEPVLAARLETSPVLAETADWIAATTGPEADLFMVNYFDQFSPPVLEWTTAIALGDNPPSVRGIILAGATPAQTAALREAVLAGDATHLVLVEGGPWGANFWPDYTAAFGDSLREVDRRSVRLVNYDVAGWLDENRLGDAWEQERADARQELDLGVIIYAIERK